MTGEIISVGTELLMGQILNTDAQYMAQKLAEMGINLYHQSTVGDNMGRLKECIARAMGRSDVVLLSGGLGPTQDDLTKWAVAEVLKLPLVEDEASRRALEERMSTRYGVKLSISENNYRQALFPAGATILPNNHGTAPGCICEQDGVSVVVLPGPPRELTHMMEESVIPYLEHKSGSRIASRFLRVFGMGESQVETELRDLIDAQENPTIAPYAGYLDVSLRVTARLGEGEDPQTLIQPVVDRIAERLGDCVYSTDNESMQQALARQLARRQATLALAESLTGGMICDHLVDIPGMSKHLLEGVVTYTLPAKERLGVSPAVLAAHTAVSGEVALEMAQAVRQRAGSDWGLATTGVAGPGPDENGKEEGLYYIGICGPAGFSLALEKRAGRGRDRIRRHACLTAMNELRKLLTAGK